MYSLLVPPSAVLPSLARRLSSPPPPPPATRMAELRSEALDGFSQFIGWCYFFAWSISFWPQTILNFRRKRLHRRTSAVHLTRPSPYTRPACPDQPHTAAIHWPCCGCSHLTSVGCVRCCVAYSVSGLSLDFLVYNLTGFFFYTVYAITSQRPLAHRPTLPAAVIARTGCWGLVMSAD